MGDLKPMTVAELRVLLAGLPDTDPIFVDGYEGGYDRPALETASLKTLEPWVALSAYCGAWGQARPSEGGVRVWVLSRSGSVGLDS